MKREDMKWKPEVSDEVIALTKAIIERYPHAKCYVDPELNIEDLYCAYDVIGISYDELRSIDLKQFKCLYIDDDHIWGPGVYVDCWKDLTIDELYAGHVEVEVW